MKTSFLASSLGRFAVILALASAVSAFGQSYRGKFEKHVVIVSWSGFCNRPAPAPETNFCYHSSDTVPLSHQAPGCTAQNISLQNGMLNLRFPDMTPEGTVDALKTINFTNAFGVANALQRGASFDAQWQFATTPADNNWQLIGWLNLDAPIYCPDVGQTNAPGVAAGSTPVHFSRDCGKPFITQPTMDGTDLVYRISTYLSAFVYAPNFSDAGTRIRFNLNVEVQTTYRVPTISGIQLDKNKLHFDVIESNPDPQKVILKNAGTSDLDFTVTATTKNGGNWLILDPLKGKLAPNDTTNLYVGVLRIPLAPQVTNTATLTVSGNAPNSPQTVAVEVVQKVARLVGLEVVQVVQDWNNSVLTVAGKATIVRAHLEAMLLQPVKVTGKLHLKTENGTEYEIDPLNPNIEPKFDAARPDHRAMVNNSLNFQVEPKLAQGGVVFELKADGVLCRETADTPNDCKLIKIFHPAPNPRIRFVDIVWTDASGVTQRAGKDRLKDLAQRVISCFPITGIGATLTELNWLGIGKPEFDVALETLDWMRVLDASLSSGWTDRIYYGAIAYDDTGGLAFTPGGAATGHVRPDPFAAGRHTQSHEIAHALGRPHAPPVQDAEPFPYLSNGKATLGPMTDGADAMIFGFDSLTDQLISPEDYFDLMTYEHHPPEDRWPSKFTYEGLMTSIAVRFGGTSPTPAPSVLTFFRGRIDAVTRAVTFSPPATLPVVDTPPPPPPGEYILQALNASGQVLQQIAFAPKVAKPEDDVPEALSFIIAASNNPAISQVQVVRSNQVLGTLAASANPPTVRVLSPNGGENLTGPTVNINWVGADADGDPLTYAVQYSPDNGTNWQTLIVDLPSTNYIVPRPLLQQTTMGRMRVIASDGFHSAMDASDGTFTTPNNAPEISIQSPTTNELFLGTRQIVFKAFAYDTEDGILEDTNVTWRSDRDDLLGSGASFFTTSTALSEGAHLITATVRDASGLSATGQVNVTVLHTAPSTIADLALSQTSQVTGDGLTFTITIENRGPSDATGLRLTDEIPPSATAVSAVSSAGACTVTNALASCNIASLASGATATMALQIAVPSAGTYTNRAAVLGVEVDPVPANNMSTTLAQFVPPPPQLFIAITNNAIAISWPATTQTNFVLQSSLSLSPPVWSDVLDKPTVTDGRFRVGQIIGSTSRYYRLLRR